MDFVKLFGKFLPVSILAGTVGAIVAPANAVMIGIYTALWLTVWAVLFKTLLFKKGNMVMPLLLSGLLTPIVGKLLVGAVWKTEFDAALPVDMMSLIIKGVMSMFIVLGSYVLLKQFKIVKGE